MSKHNEDQAPASLDAASGRSPARGATRDDVIEAFLAEGLSVEPRRVRAWIARYPEFGLDLLEAASHLAVATVLGVHRRVSPAERAGMRRRAVDRARDLAAGDEQGAHGGS